MGLMLLLFQLMDDTLQSLPQLLNGEVYQGHRAYHWDHDRDPSTTTTTLVMHRHLYTMVISYPN